MKAPKPNRQSLSRRFDALSGTPFTTFSRRPRHYSDRMLRLLLDAVLAQVADCPSLCEQLRITFYIYQNFPRDDFGVSKIKVM